MIWWKGSGLWMGILVALAIVSAQKTLGPIGVPVGCLSAAGIVLLLKGKSEEGSALFSIPVRFWPALLVLLAAFTFIKR